MTYKIRQLNSRKDLIVHYNRLKYCHETVDKFDGLSKDRDVLDILGEQPETDGLNDNEDQTNEISPLQGTLDFAMALEAANQTVTAPEDDLTVPRPKRKRRPLEHLSLLMSWPDAGPTFEGGIRTSSRLRVPPPPPPLPPAPYQFPARKK